MIDDSKRPLWREAPGEQMRSQISSFFLSHSLSLSQSFSHLPSRFLATKYTNTTHTNTTTVQLTQTVRVWTFFLLLLLPFHHHGGSRMCWKKKPQSESEQVFKVFRKMWIVTLWDELRVQTSLSGQAECTSKIPRPLFYSSSVGINIIRPFISYNLYFVPESWT